MLGLAGSCQTARPPRRCRCVSRPERSDVAARDRGAAHPLGAALVVVVPNPKPNSDPRLATRQVCHQHGPPPCPCPSHPPRTTPRFSDPTAQPTPTHRRPPPTNCPHLNPDPMPWRVYSSLNRIKKTKPRFDWRHLPPHWNPPTPTTSLGPTPQHPHQPSPISPRAHLRPQPSQQRRLWCGAHRVAAPCRERTTPTLACLEHATSPPGPCPRPEAAAAPMHRASPGTHALTDSGGLPSAPAAASITCAPTTVAKGPPRACGLRSVGLAGLLVDLGLRGPLQTSILPSRRTSRGFYVVFTTVSPGRYAGPHVAGAKTLARGLLLPLLRCLARRQLAAPAPSLFSPLCSRPLLLPLHLTGYSYQSSLVII